MDFAPITYTQLPKTSALFLDYLYHFDRVGQFYSGSPFNPTSYKNLAGQIHLEAKKRAELVAILNQQNESFGCGEATSANIKRLSDPGTFAVVTGQQVGLLSGP